MTLYGEITDSTSNALLPGTNVTVNDVNGIYKGITVTANSKGFFQITSPILLASDKIVFSRSEYYPTTVNAQQIYDATFFDVANGALIQMQQKISTLDPVVVTSTPKKNNLALLAAGGLLLFYLADDKKKKVSGFNFYNYYKGLPPMAKGAVVIGSGLIAYLTLRKLLKAPAPDAGEPTQAGEAVQVLASQGIYPTYTNAQYEGFANAIVQAVWDCGTDETAIYNVMNAMQNDADVLKLIQVYNIREYKGCFENFFSLVSRTLTATISSELSGNEKSEVNDILRSKGITYQFV